MEVHRQTCQSCGSREVTNLLAREPGHSEEVFVRCTHCGSLVAHYQLSGYYHHGKGIESYLRYVTSGSQESGRAWTEAFEKARQRAEEGYRRACEQLRAEGKLPGASESDEGPEAE